MMTKLALLLFLLHVHSAFNSPLLKLKELTHDTILVPTHHAVLAHPQNLIIARQKKSHNLISLPIQHILVPKLHVLPAQSNIRHSSIHTDVKHILTNNNIKIPIISQTVSHSATNITHPTPLFFIPIAHNFVPVQDLSVIPLQKNQQISHYRVMTDKKNDEEEEVNRFRTFYGGYGTGLFFGGHGAGHGFHVFG